MPMADVIRPIPLSEDMKHALIGHHGRMGELLDVAVACEHGVTPMRPGLDERRRLAGAYADALVWATAAFTEIAAES
jgi:c-di-GMP-related signal transduction protein